MNAHREAAIDKIKLQFDENDVITLEGLEQMVERRRKSGWTEQAIQEFIDSITVDVTKTIYFFGSYRSISDTAPKMSVYKTFANSVAEAIVKLEAIGEFMEDDSPISIPRLRMQAINT